MQPAAPLPPPPAEIAEITDVIGAEAALRLVRAYGGTRLHVPRLVNQGHDLALTIGLDAARRLADAWGGLRPRIPLARWWQARCLEAEGRTHREIARELRVAETSVPDLLHGRRQSRDTREQRGLAPAPTQPDLFGAPPRRA
jgi:hypothetical protein